MSGEFSTAFPTVGKIAFVDQDIDIGNEIDVVFAFTCDSVGDVGHRSTRMLETKAGRTARMFERTVIDDQVATKFDRFLAEGSEFKVGADGKQVLVEEGLFNGVDLRGLQMNSYSFDFFFPEDVVKKREPDHVIEVSVGEKDIESSGLEQIANAKHARTGIKNDAVFRNHQTGSVALFTRVVPGGSKKMQFHKSQP